MGVLDGGIDGHAVFTTIATSAEAEAMLPNIFVGIVATVVGGLIVWWLRGLLTASRSSVAATYSEVVVPTHRIDNSARAEIMQLPNLPLTLKVMLEHLTTYTTDLRVVAVKLRNGGAVRSGAVEIISDHAALWHMNTYELAPPDHKLIVGRIGPKTEITVTVIAHAYIGPSLLVSPNITVLEDGKHVPAYRDNISGYHDTLRVARLFLRHPVIAYSIAVVLWVAVMVALRTVSERLVAMW